MPIKISHQFDAGAIEVVDAALPYDIRLRLRKDSHADFSQWFYFRLQGARGMDCTMRIVNAGEASYPDGWVGYQAVASYDRQHWFRVPTSYDNGVLVLRIPIAEKAKPRKIAVAGGQKTEHKVIDA